MFSERREKSINLLDLLQIIKSRWMLILICSLLCGVVSGIITKVFIPETYQSETKIFGLNQQNDTEVTYTDYQSSSQFIKDYIEIVKSRTVMETVIKNLKLDESVDELNEMIDASVLSDTRIIKITVTALSPQEAQKIADEVSKTASKLIEEVMKIQAVNIIDKANLPEKASGPDLKINILLGLVVGFTLSAICVLLLNLLNDKINTAEEFKEYFDYPVLGSIPSDIAVKKSGSLRVILKGR
ncbi:MAG: YveK family protein [Lachnospiraceae bacterium]